MSQESSWWARQLVETIKEIALAEPRFRLTREIAYRDKVELLAEELNDTYEILLDGDDYVELGEALLAKQAPPQFRYKAYEQ